MDIFDFLFSTANWPPRWRCGKWTEALGWTHITSELLIFAAYMAIPVILIYFIRKRKDFPFHRIFFLFATFIVACGFTHLIEAIIFYYPVYRFLGFVLVITAIASWGTAFALIPILPKVLALPSLASMNDILKKDLVQVHQRFEVAVETMKAGIVDWDLEKDQVVVSESLVNLLKMPMKGSEQPASEFFDMIFFEDKENVVQQLKNNMQCDSIVTHEFRMLDGQNQPMPVRMSWKVVRNEEKKPIRVIGTILPR